MYIKNLVHMTKMAAMPIYGKNPSKTLSETGGPISKKLGMKHQWLEYYNVYINHDPVATLTYFTTRSTWVANAFEWGKLFKKSSCRKWAVGLNINDSEKKLDPRAHMPSLQGNNVYYRNIQTSPLKPLGQLKPNFMLSIYTVGGTNDSVY